MIESGRVRLRHVEMGDARAIAGYRNDPEVAKYQSWETYSFADAEMLCRRQEEVKIDTPGTWCQLAIVNVEYGEMIGDCGLRFPGAGESGLGVEIEMGITLSRAAQGRGLASDTVAGIVELVFGKLAKRVIRATVDARNARAAALLERAGFERAGGTRRTRFKGAWCDEQDYVLRATRRLNEPG